MTHDPLSWASRLELLAKNHRMLMPKAQAEVSALLLKTVTTHGSRKFMVPELDYLDDSTILLPGMDKAGNRLDRGGTWKVKNFPKTGEYFELQAAWKIDNAVNVILTMSISEIYTVEKKVARNVDKLILPLTESIEIGVLSEPLVKLQLPAHMAFTSEVRFGLRSEAIEDLMRCLAILESEKGLAP